MSHCVADGSPNDSSSTANPTSGLQNAAEVSTMPPTNAPSESSYPPETHQPSRSKKQPSHNSTGTGKPHSRPRHRSPHKKTSTGKHKGKKSTGKQDSKSKDEKGSDGHRHRSSGGHHRSRHRSPDRKHGRSRSAENTLDSRHGGRRHGRSPDKRHGHHRHRSPHRSPRRSPYRSPHRTRSPHRSRYQSPRRHAHSSDPYRRHDSPERRGRGNDKPNGVEAVLKEPAKTPEPSLPLEDSILREPPALDRLNREATLPLMPRQERLYGEDSLLLRASSMERAYKGGSLLRDVASRGQRDAYRDITLPRVRTPESDSAYKRYSSLLRGRSTERMERDAPRYASRDSSPEPSHYRARSLGRDISPIRSFRRDESEDEEDEDNFISAKVREYYSTLQSNRSQSPKPALPEPKKTYKENPKDLSI